MHLNSLFLRFRRFHAPVGMLLVLLQRTPVLRLMLPGAEFALSSTAGQVLKCAFGLAAMGAYDSLAGATTFTVVSSSGTATGGAKANFPISGTVGTAINGATGVTYSVSGAPGTPKSFGVTDSNSSSTYSNTLPPGLSVSPLTGTTAGGAPYYDSSVKLTITGTPTTAGTYAVRLWASDGKALNGGNSAYVTATFTIGGGGGGNVAPAITTQPSSQTVTAGASISFTVAASGTPTPTYQWQKGGTNIAGATNATYTIASVVVGDAGSYTAVATNAAGSATSSAATLTVNAGTTAPAITTQPSSQTVTAGTSVSFTVAASGSPTPTYQWQKGGVNIAGATSATYSIASTVAGDAGNYTAVATNSAGSATSNAATLTVNAAATPPAITTQPSSQTVTAGASVSFTVAASGSPTPTYQWQKGGVNIAGATNATYTIASTVVGDAGNYSAVATNSAGSATSNAAVLTVNAATAAPTITTQPVSQSVTAGTSVTFTVAASGSPTPTYQWQKGGVNIAGATSATYTIASVAAGDAGSYTAVATNSQGSATSSAASLTVNILPAFTTQPVTQTVFVGGPVTLTVAASGTPAPTFQWQKGGVNIAGATSATYTIASAVAGDAGNYTAIATNTAGSVTSSTAVLTVSAALSAPTFTTQPGSQTVNLGGSVTFTSVANGNPAPTYQWKKGGVNIAGATSANYTIASTVAGDAASYTVVATNSQGSATSSAATLTVNLPPTITTQPLTQTVTVGAAATFTVVATGTPAPTYQWQKGGVNIAGATSATYTIASTVVGDAGNFTVVVTNSAGSVTSSVATLTVSTAPAAPTITTQPLSQSIVAGSPVTFTVVATGNPTPTYQWKKGTTNIAGATSASYTIASTVAGSAGNYSVVVTNSQGTVTSSTAVLTITAPVAPSITTQPVSQTVTAGTSVTFTVVATGAPAPTYQWRKNGVSVPGAGTSASYTIASVQATDLGTYTVVVTNTVGSVTSNGAVLTLPVAPSVTTQPLSSAVFVGGSVTLAPVVTGTPIPTYQWQKNGINIPGATNATLSLANAQLTDAGDYALIATNMAGTVTTRYARVVVLVTQANAATYAVTTYPTGVTVGGTVSLDFLLTNVGTKNWGANHYLSIRDSGGTFLAFTSLQGANSGEVKTANLRFTAPTTPGTYTYYAQGLENGVAFFSTQNVVTLTVLAKAPNSVTYNSTNFPYTAAPGATLNFTYNVTNTGTQNWGANHFLSLRDGNNNYSSFIPMNGMTPGQSKTVNFSLTVPTTPGVYAYVVQAVESGVEFFNSQANLTLIVTAPQANAAVYTSTRSSDNVLPGATVNLSYSLGNSGTGAWGANHFLSLRDANGTYLAFVPLNGVAAGGTATADFSFAAPTTPGSYTYYVQAMENGVEFFSTQDLVTLTVLATPIQNAITYNATTLPRTVTRGATVSFTYDVTNRGTKTWTANHYLSLRDADNVFFGFPTLGVTAPGGSKTVTFSFVAPSSPGVYTYRIQGLEAGVEFFNETDSQVIFVP